MECPDENDLLEYSTGQGSVATRRAIHAHVLGCLACSTLLSEVATNKSYLMETKPLNDPLVGTRLGEFEVLDRIGEGGMGIVYKGRQPLIGKTVAIKVIRPDLSEREAELVPRLLEEARAANAIGHHGIIDIFSFGQTPQGWHYFVMEYLIGEPLSETMRMRRKLPVEEVLELLESLLGPLVSAHAAGIVHRDLKPSNLFVVMQPDGSRFVKLLDFGIAKLMRPGLEHTVPGAVLGTLGYMAPEQLQGKRVDPRADLYAVGVIGYELVTGLRPFPRVGADSTLAAQLKGPVPRASADARGVPERFDALLTHLTQVKPEARPASADEVLREVMAIQAGLERTIPVASALDDRVGGSESAEPAKAPGPVLGGAELARYLAIAGGVMLGISVLLWWLAGR